MIKLADISLTQKMRTHSARLCCLIIASLFLFLQSISASHAHDHDHHEDEPLHTSCDVCLLAVSDEGDSEIKESLEPKIDGVPIFFTRFNKLALLEFEQALSSRVMDRSIDPPPDLKRRPDAARAPPIYI